MFILVFIDIYLFFQFCGWGWGIHPPYPLFHGGNEGWNPHTSCSTVGAKVGAKVEDRGILGMRVGGMRDTSPRSPIVEPGG